jgi:hypothetical protein
MYCYYYIGLKPSPRKLIESIMLVLQATIKHQHLVSNLNAFGPQSMSFIKSVFVTQPSCFKFFQYNLLVLRQYL